MKKIEVINKLINAIKHYEKTGKHKMVQMRYDPETRTDYNFKSWKNDRDKDSVRSILPEDLIMSKEGNLYVVGFDNRYNLKQFASQHDQHYRAYRLDRIQDE